MKRLLATLLAALLLLGALSLTASAANEPRFRRPYYKVRYHSSTQLTYTKNGDFPVYFEIDDNTLGLTVDENGRVHSGFSLRKWGIVKVTIRSGDGSSDIAWVEVDADLWQWIIIVGLLGWVWY